MVLEAQELLLLVLEFKKLIVLEFKKKKKKHRMGSCKISSYLKEMIAREKKKAI